MKLLHIITSSIYQIVALIFFVAFLLGVLNIHFSDRTNYCEMTFMYEYPQFVKISLPENKEFPSYGLYAYSEGRLTERARKMWFDGVPVLYLPGNSGSHMQARSLASVALRKALSRGNDFHFDFFTISYNEELSGLFGGVLVKQTKFAAACVSKILSLYQNRKYMKSVPTSVILIGHSMGGLIAKRLLAYPNTMNTTNIAIALAAPLAAPVINFDSYMDDYYFHLMEKDWEHIRNNPEVKAKKVLLSFGSGARDLLVPAGLTASQDSDFNVMTTSVPGVWISSDHVSIVWCKQLVLAINRFLFSMVDPELEQVVTDKQTLMSLAQRYFVANRSMFLNPNITQPTSTMLADAFWYEDNRRIYQISRPEISRMTYLMIRLVSFPQNRFVAIEAIDSNDKDWLFGCNSQYTYNSYRYCKQATSLTELSRWTGAAAKSGKRKLATIHLHSLAEKHPDWTHVIVKVSPTRKPVTLNIDINDHASRHVEVKLPSEFSFSKTTVIQETEANSLYYELVLPGFNAIYQAYLLYVEPTSSCKASEYHVSAEVQVPWAENQEYHYYFTQQKRSPMKLRLYATSPNVSRGLEPSEHVKVVLLLDPQCQYTVSIASSWYHLLAQSARTYTPVLIPYLAAIVLLVARRIIIHFDTHGTCLSIHGALWSDGLKPYAPLLFLRVTITLLMAVPLLSYLLWSNANFNNLEVHYFIRSIMVLPAYFTAMGLLNVVAAVVLGLLVFSSQIAHRMLFRILWKGGRGFAESLAIGLQKVPLIVSTTLVGITAFGCGAAALAAGAAFYAFMISKLYEEYLEDYFYKFTAKYASRLCRIFNRRRKNKNKKPDTESTVVVKTAEISASDANTEALKQLESESVSFEQALVPAADDTTSKTEKRLENNTNITNTNKQDDIPVETKYVNERLECKNEPVESADAYDLEAALDNINFHMMMFFLWMTVTMLNIPALLTWARNFKYGYLLKPDTSWGPGVVLSFCSVSVWQIELPRRNLKFSNVVSSLIFVVAILIFTLGPLSLAYVNYGVTFVFAVISIQQLLDSEDFLDTDDPTDYDDIGQEDANTNDTSGEDTANEDEPGDQNKSDSNNEHDNGGTSETEYPNKDCDPCNENGIYNMFKNLREKFSFNEG